MKRIIKFVIWTAILAGVVIGVSYIGARARTSVFLGSPLPDLGPRVVEFNYDGIPEFTGNPKAWTITYGPGQLPGTPRIRVFVSPTGRLIGTLPRDLQTRLSAYRAQRLNP